MPDTLADLPQLAQRQDALDDQIRDLIEVANRLGMYDAADYVRSQFTQKRVDASVLGDEVALDALAGIPAWVAEGIDVATAASPGERFSATRWPFTYAYDFVRQHPEAFGVTSDKILEVEEGESHFLSRGGCSQVLRDRLGVDSSDPLYVAVCERLAGAYCAANGVVVPPAGS